MKTVCIFLMLMVILGEIILSPRIGHAKSAEKNLIRNPGFELVKANGPPVEWWVGNMHPTKPGAIFSTSPNAFKGKKSVFIEGTTPENHGYWQQNHTLQPGASYKFSAYVKVEKIGEDPIKVKFLYVCTRKAEKYWGVEGGIIRESVDWKYVEKVFTVPNHQEFYILPILLEGVGTVWVDEVSLTLVSREELVNTKEKMSVAIGNKHIFLAPGPVEGVDSFPTLGSINSDWWIEADIYASSFIPDGVMYFRKQGEKACPLGRLKHKEFSNYGLEEKLVTISYDVSKRIHENGRYDVILASPYGGGSKLRINEMRLCSREGEKIIDGHKDFLEVTSGKGIFPYLCDPGSRKDIGDAEWWIEADVCGWSGRKIGGNGVVFLKEAGGYIIPVGRWTAGTIRSQDYGNPSTIFYDISNYIEKEGEYCVILGYVSGDSSLSIKEVRLCSKKGKRLVDSHRGGTGTATRQNVYRFNLGEVAPKSPFSFESISASALFSVIGRKEIAIYSFLVGKDKFVRKTPQPIFVNGVDFSRGNVGKIGDKAICANKKKINFVEWDLDFPCSGIYDLYLLYASGITRQATFYLDGKRINPTQIDGNIYGIPHMLYSLDYPRQVSTGSDALDTALWEKQVSGLKIDAGYHILTMSATRKGRRNFKGHIPTVIGLVFQPQKFAEAKVKESVSIFKKKAESAVEKTSFSPILDNMERVDDWHYMERFGDCHGTFCSVFTEGIKNRCTKINYSFNNKDKNKLQGANTCYFTKFGKWDLAEYAGLTFSMKGDGTDNRVAIFWVDNKDNVFCLGSFSLSKDSWDDYRCNLNRQVEFVDAHNIREFRILLNEGTSKMNSKGCLYIDEMKFVPKHIPEDIARELTGKEVREICGGLKKGNKLKAEVKKVCIEPVDPGKWSLLEDPVTKEDLGTHFRGLTPARSKTGLGTCRRDSAIADYSDEKLQEGMAKEIYYIDRNYRKPASQIKYNQMLRKIDKHFLGYGCFGEWDGHQFGWKMMMEEYFKHGVVRYKTRKEGYENFMNAMRNKIKNLPPPKRFATISSLFTLQHYFAEIGCRLLGLETSQGLPSAILGYAFNRGASKQYGVLRWELPSVYNRFSFKEYLRDKKGGEYIDGGPNLGPTLGLLKRLWYVSYMSGTSIIGLEDAHFTAKGEISPIGNLQREAIKWCKEHPDIGEQYTPVALMLEHGGGWIVPRHLYSSWCEGRYRVWGIIPYDKGDYQIDNFFRLIFPGYEDSSYCRNERGFLTATPYGDKFDVLLDNAQESVLDRYNLIILLGRNEIDKILEEKLKRFVKKGGDIVISIAQAKNLEDEFLGVKLTGEKEEAHYTFSLSDGRYFPENIYIYDVIKPTTAKVLLINENKDALVTVNRYGKGQVIVVAPEFWMTKELKYGQANFPEYCFASPKYKILSGVIHILSDYFKDFDFVKIDSNDPIQYLVNMGEVKDKLVLTLVNNVDREWVGKVRVKGAKIIKVNGWTEDKGTIKKGILEARVPSGDVSIYEIRTDRDFMP